jgi:hypothetical protein
VTVLAACVGSGLAQTVIVTALVTASFVRDGLGLSHTDDCSNCSDFVSRTTHAK